jgi:hypothetical protein
MASHWSFGHMKPKLWANEGPGVKLEVWLPTTKSRESTRSRRALGSATRRWKALEEGYKFGSDLVPIGGRGEKLRCPKVPGVQNRDSFGTPLWESRDKQPLTWVWARQSNAENTIGRMVVTPPESRPWCVMWVRVSPWLVPTLNACRMSYNQLVLFWMQVRDQIAWSLPSLISGLLARPSNPFNVGSRERPPSPNFSQLYIVEPSSGFSKRLRNASFLLLSIIFYYSMLFHFKLFFVILNHFILGYFRLCEIIISYFWLLKVISPYGIIDCSKLYYHMLFVVIILMVIGGYWWLFYWWLLWLLY